MKTSILALALGLTFAPAALATDFQPYPGATLNDQLTKEVLAELAKQRPRAQLLYGHPQIYTTNASFEDVVQFYKKLGAKEVFVPTPWTTGPHEETVPATMIEGAPPGGIKFKKAIFVLDGAAEPFKSRRWIEISHPVAGKLSGKKIGDIQQVTGITYVQKKEALE
jgi:hypothetical protein